MFRTLGKSLCLILLSAATICSTSYGGEKLRYQMAIGGTYKYALTSENKTRVQAMGQEMATNASTFFGISLTVENTTADAITCLAKIDTNLSRIESVMMKDSALVVKEINGKRVRLTLNTLGKVLKTVVIDSVAPSRVMQMLGGGNPADILRGLFVKLPEQPVGVGDTWKYTTSDTLNVQSMKLITKPDILFKIAGTKNVDGYDCVQITFEGTGSQYGTGSRQGTEMVIDGTTKTKGTAFFASKEGVLVSVESENSADMNISGAGEQMFTATQATSSSSKMKLVK